MNKIKVLCVGLLLSGPLSAWTAPQAECLLRPLEGSTQLAEVFEIPMKRLEAEEGFYYRGSRKAAGYTFEAWTNSFGRRSLKIVSSQGRQLLNIMEKGPEALTVETTLLWKGQERDLICTVFE